ncbi:hypothetical protein E0H22_13745 [Rhodopseudomonas boonkerdii]|uniref:hypothetical protein n=1 Tax=Rhodopseudomonas boonkerdii TaxID=475937 RepID=UPI001E36F64F|nr:hypothetical protein [Rhodopseudomonas boonkerdii]UGV26653.1 hypothetical protein E0H22_13745 [Rhodopseudomonas boonkerdii]
MAAPGCIGLTIHRASLTCPQIKRRLTTSFRETCVMHSESRRYCVERYVIASNDCKQRRKAKGPREAALDAGGMK